MRPLADEEQIAELARLQAGARVTNAVLDHVRQVLADVRETESGRLF
jgi:DNA repair ATPase RecN